MNFDGMRIPDVHEYELLMKIRIMKWLSIAVSVSFTCANAIPKVANKIARKYPERTTAVYFYRFGRKAFKSFEIKQN